MLQGNWLYQFDNLDVVDDAGNVIAYTVSEEPVEGYETTIEGTNITNSRTPEVVKIPVTKFWKDNDNQDGVRPDKVTVRLLADGTEVASQELSAATDWKTVFKSSKIQPRQTNCLPVKRHYPPSLQMEQPLPIAVKENQRLIIGVGKTTDGKRPNP